MSKGLALYRWFNKKHELLYIGISSSIGSRIKAHSKTSDWFLESAYMTIEWVKTPEELDKKERVAIRKERPLYNISHNYKPRRRAFSTAITQREFSLLVKLELLSAKQNETSDTMKLLEARLKNTLLEKQILELELKWEKLKPRLFIACNHERANA